MTNNMLSKIGYLLVSFGILLWSFDPLPNTTKADYQLTSTAAQQVIIHFPGDVPTLHDAFATVPDGGVIEIASGTYVSPTGPAELTGWNIANLNKRFTVRAAPGANVILSGGGSRVIIRYQNTVPLSSVKFVTFENIHFANGYSNIEGLAGGLTLYTAKAIFKNCIFSSNVSETNTTPGGAVFVSADSQVFFFNTYWTANRSKMGGAGLGIRAHSQVYIHASQFISNNNGNLFLSAGGAINLGNSTLRVTNSNFDNNRSGLHGGAIYIIGNWTPLPRTTPQADVIISNSLFTNNSAMQDASSGGDYTAEGGAINIEDQSRVKVYSSRFYNNKAKVAGAINNFRSELEVHGSVFLGNEAVDPRGYSGFGGSISLNSNDLSTDGTDNKPNASLVLRNSWLQGRHSSTTTAAISGACLATGGDNKRLDTDDVPNVGTVAENRAQVIVTDTVFYDCDTRPSIISPYEKAASAAVYAALTNLTFQNNIIANSDATTNNSVGGALTLIYDTEANITGSTLAGNSAATFGGAIFIQGARANISGSKVFENNTSDVYGAAIFSSVDEGRNINATGSINNNIFSHNTGPRSIFEDDRDIASAPYNSIQYNGNQFYNGVPGAVLYQHSFSGEGEASFLNILEVKRPKRGVNTDKSPQSNNTEVTIAPFIGSIMAAPNYILTNRAVGEPTNPTARVMYAWSGGNATYNNIPIVGVYGASEESSPGQKTLAIGSAKFNTTVGVRPNPTANFVISGNAPNYQLGWSLQSGTFLEAVIDQDVNNSSTANGSVNITETGSNTFDLYIITEEGGFLASVSTNAASLDRSVFLPLLRR